MFNKLKQINELLIEKNKNNKEELKKQKLIQGILSNINCFYNMDIETAYSILRDLEIPEYELKNVYKLLIEPIL